MRKRILILGSSGILGKNLVKHLKNKYKVSHNGLTKRKFNLTRLRSLKKILNHSKPDLIINCAAVTNLDFCEKNKLESKKINFGITKNLFLLRKIHNFNYRLLQISTDQMYNNKKRFK